ncbi:MAG: hypothetical protein ACOY35_09395 [Bacillota bacterium]
MTTENDNHLELSDFEQVVELLEKCLWWHHKAVMEFRALPQTVRLEAIQHLVGIVRKPSMGKALEFKHGMDLTGYRKVFFDGATRRIVYDFGDDGRIRIWSMGDRFELQAYKDTHRRANKK